MAIEEKRRELFEPWVIEEAKRRSYAHLGCVLKRDSIGGYAITWVDMAWLGFNAALDAVVIEFVHEYEATDTGEHAQQTALVANCMLDDCRAAIESTGLGIKVKP